jgi:Fe-S-cluster containining protein
MEEKILELANIYSAFAQGANGYTCQGACQKGCGFCCTDAGSIDMTTLEGVQIQRAIKLLPRSRQISLAKALAKNLRKREKQETHPCPFLLKNRGCMIYQVRPFACRRIYSNHVCTRENPPQVNRHVMEMAASSIRELQQLDNTGYSGHISFVLHMLDTPAFLETYLAGEFKPEAIMRFGKSHGIVINKMMI